MTMSVDPLDVQDQFRAVTGSLEAKFFSSGTYEIPKQDFILFYGKNENSRRVDLSTATEDQLQNLAQVCGKASMLKPKHFASNFNPERSGMLEAIRPTLLDGYLEKHGIEAELTELNIYGEGSRFSDFKDTPINEHMFASLIVAFPTYYEGANLCLRHGQDEWSIDFKNMLADTLTSIAYVAIFCDVEQTLTPITSGHLVTLKYRLYLPDIFQPSSLPAITTWNELLFKRALSDLLSNTTFLPDGGQLGYSLRYHYPISHHYLDDDDNRCPVSRAFPPLKGIDAVFMRICEEFSLQVNPYVVYSTSHALVMSDRFYPLEFTEYDTKVLIENGHQILESRDGFRRKKGEIKHWVSELRSYGNNLASFVSGGLCLCAEVGPVHKRATI